MVCAGGPLDEFLDVWEGVRREGVDRGDGGEAAVFRGGVGVEAGEEEDEKHETVFAAVVGEGELVERVPVEGGGDDVEGGAGLMLDFGQEGVGWVGFGEEGVDFGVAVGDYAG